MPSYDALLLDAGTGNLSSVRNALQYLGYRVLQTHQPEDLVRHQTRLILPGVGAFAKFMQGLNMSGLSDAIRQLAVKEIPLLGICVGMQALFDIGEEMGHWQGLSLLPGRVTRFPSSNSLKIPHTGWNQVWSQRQDVALLAGLPSGSYFYFNHAYFCTPLREQHAVAKTEHGIQYACMVADRNIFGVQFHPEKSQSNGLTLLKNYMRL